MFPPALTLFGIFAMLTNALFAAVLIAVILAELDCRLFMVLLIVVRFDLAKPSCWLSWYSPTKKELPSSVTLPFNRSSKIIEDAQLTLVTAVGILCDCENPS